MQAHRLRRQRKAHRKRLAKARQTDGSAGKRNEALRKRNPERIPSLSRNEKLKVKNEKLKAMKKETWKYIIQTAIAILTAILTTLGVTSCMGTV